MQESEQRGGPTRGRGGLDPVTQPARRRGSLSLADYPGDMVRLVCERCGRLGQYRKATLLAQYPADTPLPDLRHMIASCDRHDRLTGGCGVRYEGLDQAIRSA